MGGRQLEGDGKNENTVVQEQLKGGLGRSGELDRGVLNEVV